MGVTGLESTVGLGRVDDRWGAGIERGTARPARVEKVRKIKGEPGPPAIVLVPVDGAKRRHEVGVLCL